MMESLLWSCILEVKRKEFNLCDCGEKILTFNTIIIQRDVIKKKETFGTQYNLFNNTVASTYRLEISFLPF